jgi:6-pyruvoyl-tetrahydropterin synthase
MSSFSDKLTTHNQRARSARSEKVEKLSNKHLNWQNEIDKQKQVQKENFLKTYNSDIKRQLNAKDVARKQRIEARDDAKKKWQQSQDTISRRSRNYESIKSEQNHKNRKLNDKFQHELNSMKSNNNRKNKEHEQQQLNSIKERVWKKHKMTFIRRKKQMKEVLPPSTYEIYM